MCLLLLEFEGARQADNQLQAICHTIVVGSQVKPLANP